MTAMSEARPAALRAVVENGRLELDEPTPPPEGQVFDLVPVEKHIDDATDDLADEERSALHRELEESMAEVEAGAELIDAETVLAERRANAE